MDAFVNCRYIMVVSKYTAELNLFGLTHTSAFFMRRVALRHSVSEYNFYFRRCFSLDAEKLDSIWHHLVLVLSQDAELQSVSQNTILSKSRLDVS